MTRMSVHSIPSARRLIGRFYFAVRDGLQNWRKNVPGRRTGESERKTQIEKSEMTVL